MAIPTYQAINTSNAASANNTIAWPTHQSGNYALLFVETNSTESASLSTTGGFTQISNSPQSDATSTNTKLTVFSCVATSSSMTSPVISNPGNHSYAVMITYRGCRTATDAIDATNGGSGVNGGSTENAVGVTSTVNDCLIVQAMARGNDSTSAGCTGATNSNLSNLTQRNNAGTTDGNGGTIVIYDGGLATAGASGSTSLTFGSSVNSWASIAVSLAPPVSGNSNMLAFF